MNELILCIGAETPVRFSVSVQHPRAQCIMQCVGDTKWRLSPHVANYGSQSISIDDCSADLTQPSFKKLIVYAFRYASSFDRIFFTIVMYESIPWFLSKFIYFEQIKWVRKFLQKNASRLLKYIIFVKWRFSINTEFYLYGFDGRQEKFFRSNNSCSW